jgi:hypothetical protein
MTRHTVAWDDDVEAAFIETWLTADSTLRADLREIANWLDASLIYEPRKKVLWT